MRVAMLADPVWLQEELPTLRRLVVGLVAEQVQVVRVVPGAAMGTGGAGVSDGMEMISQTLRYPGAGWRVWRDRQLRGMAPAMREMELDVIHAMSGAMERPAVALGAALGVPVVVGLWSRREAECVHGAPTGASVTYAAVSPAVAEAAQRRVGPGVLVEVIGPSAYCRESDPPALLRDPKQGLSVLVVGDGVADGAYLAMLEAMARVRHRMAAAVYLFYACGADQHRVWRAAKKMKLLDQVSLAPTGPGSRALLVQADAVFQPQGNGVVRSLVVEAMAAGRPIVAGRDAAMEPLLTGERAVVMERAGAEDWEEVLRQMAEDPQRFVKIGQAGRQYVFQHHRASGQVERTLELYRKLAAPPVLSFGR